MKRAERRHDVDRRAASSESTRTVVVALLANILIAIAKLVAASVSRSSAMLAEAIHAFADSGNQILLMVAQKRGDRPADDAHPLGHGREAYFWALIAALTMFVTGALLSVRQGVLSFLHPAHGGSFAVAYGVLAVSLVLEGVSLLRAYRQLRREAQSLRREFLEHLDLSSDPIARAVFAEDAAAVAGNIIAAVGVGLHQVTGSAVPDAVAAIVVGLTLGYVAFQLARRNADFLVGKQASAGIRRQIAATIERQRGVGSLVELLVLFVGPRRLWVMAHIGVGDDIKGTELKALARETEQTLVRQSPAIARVDIVVASRTRTGAR